MRSSRLRRGAVFQGGGGGELKAEATQECQASCSASCGVAGGGRSEEMKLGREVSTAS